MDHALFYGHYSSPHLIAVRERIRINGIPLEKATFSDHFWRLYNKLSQKKVFSVSLLLFAFFLLFLARKSPSFLHSVVTYELIQKLMTIVSILHIFKLSLGIHDAQ